jgi:cytochrome c-type biogenesis protein CcmH
MHPGRSLLVAALALVLLLPAAAWGSEQHPSQGEMEGEVMCPTCHTTLDQSDSPIAQRMKVFIAGRIAAGATKTQIENELISTFGQSVIARPSTHGFDLVAWLLPIVGLLGGAAVVGFAAWRWSRARGPVPGSEPPLDAEVERRVDEELARYDV